MTKLRDPVEKIVRVALVDAGVRYTHETEAKSQRLDFYLPDFDTFIEVKQFHTPRIGEQMAQAKNVIAIQGVEAAALFAMLVTRRPV